MADEAQSYGFRARTAQLLTWLFGRQQQAQQQQIQKSDRQVFDGYDRGNDDPDNRRTMHQAQAFDLDRGSQSQRGGPQPPQDPTLSERAEAFRQRLTA